MTLPNFKPQSLSTTEGEEKSYRRGFDQGVAATLYAMGLSSEAMHATHFKQRSSEFRDGIQKFPPWNATSKEKLELREGILCVRLEELL